MPKTIDRASGITAGPISRPVKKGGAAPGAFRPNRSLKIGENLCRARRARSRAVRRPLDAVRLPDGPAKRGVSKCKLGESPLGL
jgi:hypothetical protein